MQTGRYSPRSGLGSIIIAGTPNTLQASETTLGEMFSSMGYATGYFGKWHLGSSEASWPTRQGYDVYGVGVLETTDGVLYRDSMQRSGVSEDVTAASEPGIWESDASGKLNRVRNYTLDYRRQIEGDIARASADYIKEKAKAKQPFLLYVGWTHTHYPSLAAPEFLGKSGIGPYGDAVMELDFRTGQVLDAIRDSGIENNTIVIWLSDNAATPNSGPPEFRGGSNLPFRGELGDALEGSLRVPGMIKWPGKIIPRTSNEMVSIHDFFPTLAKFIGYNATANITVPIDGVDQGPFFLGDQARSNREDLITFIGDEIAAVRWRQYRIYPKQQVNSGFRTDNIGYPAIFNIERDPQEEVNIAAAEAWVAGQYFKVLGEYFKSLETYPNPQAVDMTPGTD